MSNALGTNSVAPQHRWMIEEFGPGIQVERCKCGAEHYLLTVAKDSGRFLAASARVTELNKAKKDGDAQCSRAGTLPTTPPVAAAEKPAEVPATAVAAEPNAPPAAEAAEVSRLHRICKVCKFAYEHDEQKWCPLTRCPSRVFAKKRLPFRVKPVPTPDEKPVEITKDVTKTSVPPRPAGRGPIIHKYYEGNRPAIEADIATLGGEAAKERWHFGKTSWRVFSQGAASRKPHEAPAPNLPILPPWNETWDRDVKVAWLNCQRDILLGTNSGR